MATYRDIHRRRIFEEIRDTKEGIVLRVGRNTLSFLIRVKIFSYNTNYI